MLEDGQIASLDPLTGKLRWAVAPPMSDRAYLGLVVSSSAGSLLHATPGGGIIGRVVNTGERERHGLFRADPQPPRSCPVQWRRCGRVDLNHRNGLHRHHRL